MIVLLNSFTQKFIITSHLQGGACVDTSKRLWYNDKVAFICLFRLPLPCVNE
jgi:hypothetical protein